MLHKMVYMFLKVDKLDSKEKVIIFLTKIFQFFKT